MRDHPPSYPPVKGFGVGPLIIQASRLIMRARGLSTGLKGVSNPSHGPLAYHIILLSQ